MAVVTRRYVIAGPSTAELQRYVSATAALTAVPNPATGAVDIQIDDTVDGILTALDEYMTQQGFVLLSAAPTTQTDIVLRSPDGTEFALRVDDLGVVTITAI